MDDQQFKEQLSKMQDTLDAATKMNFSVPEIETHVIDTSVIRRMNRKMDILATEESKRHMAVFDTAKNTKRISDSVQSIDELISSERTLRENADKEIQARIDKIIKSQRFNGIKDLLIAIIGAAIGVAFTVFATRHGWL